MGRPTTAILLHPAYNELAQTFYTHLLQLGYNGRSSRSKWRILKEFLSFAETTISTDITRITTKDILSYYSHLQQRPNKKTGQPLSEKTIWGCMHSVQQFYTLLQNKGEITTHPGDTIKILYPTTESPRRALTQAEIKELYQHATTLQERAILGLAYGCGLRVSELVYCNTEDVKLREALLIVPKGKGNKPRTIPLCKTLVKDLTNYFFKVRLQEKSESPDAFILNANGTRMQRGTYNKKLKQLIDRTENTALKNKQATIHTLRHSIATHLIENGVSLEKVRDFLGHSQLETTETYTHISHNQLQKLVD